MINPMQAMPATIALALLLVSCASAPSTNPPSATSPPDSESTADDRSGPPQPAEQETEEPPVQMESDPLPPAPDPAAAFKLSADEVYPNAKRLAADVAQAVTTYGPDDELEDVLAGFEEVEPLLDSARPLHHPAAWSRGKVIYPQLGGITDDRVSVMVVVEQRIGTPDQERTETRTLDVRLRLQGERWVVDRLASTGGQPIEANGSVPEEAQAILDDPRIELPDSARWDILAGDVSIDLLRLMARAAKRTPFGVVVLSTGHPFEIFGTDRQSDHTKGQAIDIYRVGDTPVIDNRSPDSPTYDLVQWFYEQPEVARIGSPWALDGYGGRSFTDVVHQDHLHVAVR